MTRFKWCENFVFLRGRPLSFAGRPYLRAIYNSAARRIVLRCSRQVEKTTFICNAILHAAVTLRGVHIVVVFPRDQQAKVFAKSRLLPMIEESALPRRLLLGSRARRPQVTHMRFQNKSEVFLRAAYASRRNLVLRCSRQTEKSAFLVNTILYEACTRPGIQMLFVCPRIEQARVFSHSRLLSLGSDG